MVHSTDMLVNGTSERVAKLALKDDIVVHICKNQCTKHKGFGELWVDTSADTVCLGQGFVVLLRMGRHVTLKGYHDDGDKQ